MPLIFQEMVVEIVVSSAVVHFIKSLPVDGGAGDRGVRCLCRNDGDVAMGLLDGRVAAQLFEHFLHALVLVELHEEPAVHAALAFQIGVFGGHVEHLFHLDVRVFKDLGAHDALRCGTGGDVIAGLQFDESHARLPRKAGFSLIARQRLPAL